VAQPNQYSEKIAANRAEVDRLTKLGWSAAEISDAVGITKRSVVRNRRALGISGRVGRPFSDDEHERILSMLEDGVSLAEIGRTIGRSTDVLWCRYKGMSRASNGCGSIKLRRKLGLLI
jgi:IS30 family transposase